MAHHPDPRPRVDGSSRWWVFAAWASLALLVVGGLAGAAGIG